MTLVREPAWNTTSQRAGQVFVESLTCGYVLGFATAFPVVLVFAVGNASEGAGAAAFVYPLLAGGFGGTLGLIVGLFAGVAGGLVVRTAERRLGARVVAWLLPIIGLAVSLPVAWLFARPGDANWRVFVLTVAVVLSLIGSTIVASRYLRRAEWPPVH